MDGNYVNLAIFLAFLNNLVNFLRITSKFPSNY